MPMPVSMTSISSTPVSIFAIFGDSLTVILPSVVNLSALLNRFSKTCRKRQGSPLIHGISSGAITVESVKFFSCALVENSFMHWSISSTASKMASSKSSFPASTLVKSKISLINDSKFLPAFVAS